MGMEEKNSRIANDVVIPGCTTICFPKNWGSSFQDDIALVHVVKRIIKKVMNVIAEFHGGV